MLTKNFKEVSVELQFVGEIEVGADIICSQGALFWLSELVICQWDQGRWACNVVGKVFIPCLITFALTDLLLIP